MRLGDLEAARRLLLSYYPCVNENTHKSNYMGDTLMSYEVADMIEDCIENTPTIDAVPVVRCRDCRHSSLPSGFTQRYGEPGTLSCHFGPCNRRNVNANDFCSYGQRKEGEHEVPYVGWCAIGMEEGMFPSIRPGETVALDDIIGGAE